MPSFSRHPRRDAAAVAQQRLARLADEIAAVRATRGSAAETPAPGEPAPDPTAAAAAEQACAPRPTGGPRVPVPISTEPSPQGAPTTLSGRHRAASLATRSRFGAAVGDRLPGAAHRLGAERGVSGQHLTVVALVVAALVAIGAWWVLAGRPGESTPVAPVTSGAPPRADPGVSADAPGTRTEGTAHAPAPSGADTTAAAAAEVVVVDVTGRVRRPGLVTLPSGSRVADALEAAGGARPGVELTTLNLARPLVDGEQILVGVKAAPWPPPTAPARTAAPGAVPGTGPVGAPVDVNTATLEQLDTLPGIGPVTAQAILDWRAANGAFTSVDELLEVDGIGDLTLADIRDLVTV